MSQISRRSSLLSSTLLVPFALIAACGAADKAAELQEEANALETDYAAFDLSCSFEELTAEDAATEAEAAAALTDESATETSSCEDASEQYSVMVAQFDADGDGALSDAELGEAQSGWADAQKQELDANGDGTIGEDEKAAWRAEKLPARKEKLGTHFNEACERLGKPTDECRKMFDERRDGVKEMLRERREDFDKDGDGKLDEAELKAMHDKLAEERQARGEDFRKQHDKDGDGKVGPDERQNAHDNREKAQAQHQSGQQPPAGGSGQQQGAGPKP